MAKHVVANNKTRHSYTHVNTNTTTIDDNDTNNKDHVNNNSNNNNKESMPARTYVFLSHALYLETLVQ